MSLDRGDRATVSTSTTFTALGWPTITADLLIKTALGLRANGWVDAEDDERQDEGGGEAKGRPKTAPASAPEPERANIPQRGHTTQRS
ncbi:hypothetical protein HYQ44_015051 [Verticillium longisporum]|nr:hypothetical protein HYQ44_015051 [Verticillium longisporum]